MFLSVSFFYEILAPYLTSLSLSLPLSLSEDAVDMSAVVGNPALFLDVTSPRPVLPDRKTRLLPPDVVLSLSNKNPPHYHHHHIPSVAANSFDSEKESRSRRIGERGKANSKASNAADYDDLDDEEEEEEEEEEEVDEFDWEEAMRERLRELEETKELERIAEELVRGGGGEGGEEEETEEDKRIRVRKELVKVAKEQAEQRKMAQLMFQLGQKAYEKGTYGRAIEFLEGALTIIDRPTLFGGEIQIWLAMAYEANNRHRDCIALFKQLERKHPILSIRRQAADLRYISEAPKLKISREEMVTIPTIGSSYDSYAGTWTDKNKDRDERRSGSTSNQLPSTKDYLGDFMVWRPPVDWEKNRAFWVGFSLWLGLVGAALFLQR
ncbi:uncharacterized protein LOC131311655 [Rhododendron vialii]|uniref:uncharacterized protein LOC131311655 n=1 Tax=Rhododendron vialii TaxID=182163 RepID=UPI00265E02EF|nr:uncharacterized protein LOC131311655 [Rhododendron vialii]